ncbi:MAG TPA: hypothetical protein VKA44_06635, partial [Gemmatimonadota bacterium]|nr:hypothetical protein [Gemmatimonadota bacterium]
PVLSLLVGVLEDRLGTEKTTDLLREVGLRIGGAASVQGGTAERVAAARAAFEAVGAMVDVRREDGCIRLEGADCPIGSVVRDHPGACVVPATLLGEILGLPVVEVCDRSGETPRCRFEARLPGGEGEVLAD